MTEFHRKQKGRIMEKPEGMLTAVISYSIGTMVAVLAFFVAGTLIDIPMITA